MSDSILVNNFRNYEKVFVDINDGSIFVLYGSNGSGKTNFLEAISLFSSTKGLRQAKGEDCLRHGTSTFWNISFELDKEIFSSGYKIVEGKGKRIFSISGKNVRNTSEFHKDYYVLWLTYETDRLFLQASAFRRDFIDMFAISEYVRHADLLTTFSRLAKQRLVILKKTIKSGTVLSSTEQKWLDVIEKQMVEKGLDIAKNRISITKKIEDGQYSDNRSHSDTLKEDVSELWKSPDVFIPFSNKMIGSLEDIITNAKDDLEMINNYKKILAETRQKDGFSGMTTVGPNRSDWSVHHIKNDINASRCSAGEQKILLCAIFFSFIRKKIENDKRTLILLLDDISAHLDFSHNVLLFKQVRFLREYFDKNGMRIKIWISGTERSSFFELEGKAMFFQVVDNTIIEG
jgi:DNA replication and repair protein RecF